MFEKFTSANANDFRQRYQDTFGFFREEGRDPVLAKVDFVEGIVSWRDRRGQRYELNPDTKANTGFQFLPPKPGFTNTNEGVVYVKRRAARQFSRGICHRNTVMYLITLHKELKGVVWSEVAVNFKYLEMVYEANISKGDAFAAFVKGTVYSFAPSEQFAMSKADLWVYETPIGKVLEVGERVVKLKLNGDPALFRTEISDAFRGVANVEFV